MSNMNIYILLSGPVYTSLWSIQIASIMIVANLLAIIIGRYAIKVRGLGPSISISGIEGFGIPELLATTSLGHILGAGIILGLRSSGFLL